MDEEDLEDECDILTCSSLLGQGHRPDVRGRRLPRTRRVLSTATGWDSAQSAAATAGLSADGPRSRLGTSSRRT